MNNVSKLLLLLTLSLLLIGCAHNSVKPEVVTKVETIYIKVPETLLKECEVTVPYDKHLFIQKNNEVKEKILTDLAISLYGDVRECNYKLLSIKKYQKDILDKSAK